MGYDWHRKREMGIKDQKSQELVGYLYFYNGCLVLVGVGWMGTYIDTLDFYEDKLTNILPIALLFDFAFDNGI